MSQFRSRWSGLLPAGPKTRTRSSYAAARFVNRIRSLVMAGGASRRMTSITIGSGFAGAAVSGAERPSLFCRCLLCPTRITACWRAATGVDTNREHIYPFAARPLGYARNNLHTPAQLGFDLRVLKMVPIWRGHLDIVAESFNLLNRQNVNQINPAFGSDLVPAAQFGSSIRESDARRVQFSLDFEY